MATADLHALSDGYVPPSLLAWRALERAAYRPPDEGVVLDLGAGLGFFTRVVAPNAVAVDLDLRQLKSGLASGAFAFALQADLRKMPVASGSVSAVVSNCVFEHIPGVEDVVREVSRVLKSGGQVQLTVPLDTLDQGFVVRTPAYARMRNRQLSHVNLFTGSGWAGLWERCGFDVVRSTTVVSVGQARRWDLLDAPLFVGWRRLTFGNLYWRLVGRSPRLLAAHRRLSEPVARWVMAGRRDSDAPVCVFFELRKR